MTKPENVIITPDPIEIRISPGVSVSNIYTITNLAENDIEILTKTIQNLANNFQIKLDSTKLIKAFTSNACQYTLTALDDSVINSSPSILFESMGGQFSTNFDISVIPERCILKSYPSNIEISMLRGIQKFYEIELVNEGGISANNLQVLLPESSWLSLITEKDIHSLLSGEKTKIVLRLKPEKTLQLGPYSGDILIVGNNTLYLKINFIFNAVSNNKGRLKITAKDEYSYFQENHPNVQNVRIRITDAFSEALIDESIAISGNYISEELNEGKYKVEVQAEKHSIYSSTVDIEPNQNTE
ncbi:MAG: hypothetical protein OMM_14457, partial [Candidatus Magnetoglobus multicellularis str. Araruama]